ncbi:MAG: putative sulfate exporter family transporter [Pseudomonadota bacterium]
MRIVPGLLLALGLALAGRYLSTVVGSDLLGLAKSPMSPIMMAIVLGITVRNALPLSATFQPGIHCALKRVLRLGIVLLGFRMSLGQLGDVGIKSLPVIGATVGSALLIVTWLSRRLGLSRGLGTLLTVGTSICGITAIVATAPTIGARDHEVSYAVACVTLFGVVAMLLYPFAAHALFNGDAFAIGLFLGTAVHDTAQVAGAGLVYEQYYGNAQALDVATVTKLLRNLTMLLIIPLVAVLHHRQAAGSGAAPRWYTLVPLFVVGFAAMSVLRTIGDAGELAFGVLSPERWATLIALVQGAAELCLAVAMAAVGLSTCVRNLLSIGVKPLAMGFVAALLVGTVSVSVVAILY